MTDDRPLNRANPPDFEGPWGSMAASAVEPHTRSGSPGGSGQSGIHFTGERRVFLKIAIRGAFLQFLTFGFYRFWLTTDIRRFLWSHTNVDGEGAEYTGTARELLFGFLFALAVLTPVYLFYFIGGVEAERAKTFASVPLGLILILFGQFALYRARRYRLTRTVWRGLRFWMDGSGWKYAFLSFGWLILVVLTLGLLYPWRAAALERYKMRHTHYGSIAGGFDATGWQFFKAGVWLWLIALIPFAGVVWSLAEIGSNGYFGMVDPAKFLGLATFVGLMFFILPFLWPFFQAIEWRWWARGAHIGDVRLASSVRGGQLLVLYLKLLFAAFLMMIALSIIGGIIYAIAEAVLRSMYGTGVAAMSQIIIAKYPYVGIGGAILSYLIAGLAFGVIQRYFLQYQYWDLMTSALQVHNIHTLDGAIAKGDLAGALGEGLADGLDIGGF